MNKGAGVASARVEQTRRGTLPAMRSVAYFFAYFWFSHRPAVGEASA